MANNILKHCSIYLESNLYHILSYKTARQVFLSRTRCLQSSQNLRLLLMSITDPPQIATIQAWGKVQVFVVLQFRKYHALILSKCQSLKARLVSESVVLSELALAPWQMHLDEQADFVAFLFCWVRRFCLTLQIYPRSNKTLCKKRKEKKKGFILKAACSSVPN